MKTKLYIPKKINVGFQERRDTYSGKLAYIIYWDDKGVLRKETSWQGWRDKKIDNLEVDNVPTEGFVLNKGVGGTRESYGWNPRNEYIRVYDPRGFEFEISVANLLFILQECTSTKGKGLEGEFVYSWQGTELVLLPVSCQEYKESSKFTSLQGKKVTKGDMVPGCSYTNKKNERLLYLGRLPYYYYDYNWDRDDSYYHTHNKMGHIFINEEYGKVKYVCENGFTKLAVRNTETPVENYSDLLEEYHNSGNGTCPVELVLSPKKLKEDEINKFRFYKKKDNKVTEYYISKIDTYDRTTQTYTVVGYKIDASYCYKIEDNILSKSYGGPKFSYEKTNLSLSEILNMEYFGCEVVLESGNKIKFEDYGV